MSSTDTVVLRRTWPQRLVILCTVAVIAGAVSAAWFLNDVYESVTEIGRVTISGDILITDTDPGEPVNFLLIGTDSALGLDPDDPVLIGRDFDEAGRFFADSITILRVNPETGQAWVLSLPRDLLVQRNGEKRINSVYFVEGPEALIETLTDNFEITVNHYVTLDFLGFREVVDELDGIPVWFDNPARDINRDGELASGLNIPTAGCHVLDGTESLQYVRSRGYQELIDGEWEYVGRLDDFGRIQRQQDFLVLALERAIDRGARSPANLSSLISSAANSMQLDSELTVAELADLGQAFSDFSPENLQRYELVVDTQFDSQGKYVGELPIASLNEETLAIFRGDADLLAPDEVTIDVYGTDGAAVEGIAVELGAQEFELGDFFVVDSVEDDNVVVYPTGEKAAAETVARYLEPIPRLVEDPDAESVALVLGADHEQVLFFFPHAVPKMRAAVAALGDGAIPDLADAEAFGTTTTAVPSTTVPSTTVPSTTVPSASADDGPETTSTAAPTTTVTTTTTLPVGPTTTAGIIGRAPEGQSCG